MNKKIRDQFITAALKVHKAVQHADISIYSGLMLALLQRSGPQGVSELADQLSISQQAVGKALRVLKLHEEVTIEADQGDMRAKIITITPTGLNSLSFVIEGME